MAVLGVAVMQAKGAVVMCHVRVIHGETNGGVGVMDRGQKQQWQLEAQAISTHNEFSHMPQD